MVFAATLRPAEEAVDKFLPWEGGAGYYSKWSNGPPSDQGFFPIGVWHQSPSNAARYKAIGIDQYIGGWPRRPGETLEALLKAEMPLIGTQNEANLESPANPIIHGWLLSDEPDNAQPLSGGDFGPCILPAEIQRLYGEATQKDATRPVLLNFGQAVANEGWPGRGVECSAHYEHYPEYIKAADIVSFDLYPVNEGVPLWWIGKGVERLREWAQYHKPVWAWIETTAYNGGPKPAPDDVRAEVWMALIHGAMGVGYFCHVFKPETNEAALLSDPDMRDAVAELNRRIRDLAPVLNTPSVANGVAVTSSNSAVPIDYMLKRWGGATYLFAMGSRPAGETTAKFQLSGAPATVVAEAIGESRSIPVQAGVFEDRFKDYQIHLYRILFAPGADPQTEQPASSTGK